MTLADRLRANANALELLIERRKAEPRGLLRSLVDDMRDAAAEAEARGEVEADIAAAIRERMAA